MYYSFKWWNFHY